MFRPAVCPQLCPPRPPATCTLSRSFEELLSNTLIKVFKLMVTLLLWLHLDACAYFFVARWHELEFGHFAPDSWVAMEGLTGASVAEQYLYSFWHVASHMTSIAYGPSNPARTEEVAATLCSQVFGAVLYAGVIGTVASIIAAADPSGAEFYRQWDELKVYMRSKEVPAPLRDRLRRYFNARWRGRKIFDESAILNSLPEPYSRSLLLHQCQWMLHSVPLLQAASEGFRLSLVPNLQPRLVMEGEVLQAQGEPPAQWWIVGQGVVGLYRDGCKFAELEDGSCFGDVPLLFGVKSPFTVQTETPCQLYALPRASFECLFSEYSDMAAGMKRIAYKAMRRWGLADTLRQPAAPLTFRGHRPIGGNGAPGPNGGVGDSTARGAVGGPSAAACAPSAFVSSIPWDWDEAERELQAEAAVSGESIDTPADACAAWAAHDDAGDGEGGPGQAGRGDERAGPSAPGSKGSGGSGARRGSYRPSAFSFGVGGAGPSTATAASGSFPPGNNAASQERYRRYYRDLAGDDDAFDIFGKLKHGFEQAGEAIRKLPHELQQLQHLSPGGLHLPGVLPTPRHGHSRGAGSTASAFGGTAAEGAAPGAAGSRRAWRGSFSAAGGSAAAATGADGAPFPPGGPQAAQQRPLATRLRRIGEGVESAFSREAFQGVARGAAALRAQVRDNLRTVTERLGPRRRGYSNAENDFADAATATGPGFDPSRAAGSNQSHGDSRDSFAGAAAGSYDWHGDWQNFPSAPGSSASSAPPTASSASSHAEARGVEMTAARHPGAASDVAAAAAAGPPATPRDGDGVAAWPRGSPSAAASLGPSPSTHATSNPTLQASLAPLTDPPGSAPGVSPLRIGAAVTADTAGPDTFVSAAPAALQSARSAVSASFHAHTLSPVPEAPEAEDAIACPDHGASSDSALLPPTPQLQSGVAPVAAGGIPQSAASAPPGTSAATR